MEEKKITLSVISGDRVLATAYGSGKVVLVYDSEYLPGDAIRIETDQAGYFVIQLEDTLGETLVYWDGAAFCWPLPFGEERSSYNPRAFAGNQHYLMVRAACKDEITCKRNLARNVYDRNQNKGMFPHAWANVETRNEAVFAARNAIDGVICPQSHGRYPYQSWGINRRPDAQWHLELGRPVQAESLVITTRADFPHDAWWVQATLQLSDGTHRTLSLKKSAEGQSFDLHGAVITGLSLCELIKSDDPSPFPALTQVELYGYDL